MSNGTPFDAIEVCWVTPLDIATEGFTKWIISVFTSRVMKIQVTRR